MTGKYCDLAAWADWKWGKRLQQAVRSKMSEPSQDLSSAAQSRIADLCRRAQHVRSEFPLETRQLGQDGLGLRVKIEVQDMVVCSGLLRHQCS